MRGFKEELRGLCDKNAEVERGGSEGRVEELHREEYCQKAGGGYGCSDDEHCLVVM